MRRTMDVVDEVVQLMFSQKFGTFAGDGMGFEEMEERINGWRGGKGKERKLLGIETTARC